MKKRFSPILLTAFSLMLLVLACKKQEDVISSSQKREQELQKILTDAKSSTTAPAVILSVARPSKNWSWSGAIGKANIGADETATALHKFRTASVTKMFTAAAVMLLVQENKLNLNDKISLYLAPSMMTQISSKVPNANNITIQNLLNHTSSFGEYTNTIEFTNLFPNSNSAPTVEQVINIGLKYSPVGNIGKWSYSNVNYNLLGMIVEKVSGKTYRTFVKERILVPLQMNNSYFPNDEFIIKPYLSSYFSLNNSQPTESDNSTVFNCNWATAAGDLITTVGDLQTFLQSLMQGKIVTAQSLEVMKNKAVPSAYLNLPGETYGLGLMMNDNPQFYGHGGDLIGVHTKCFYFSSLDAYMICVFNGSDDQSLELLSKVNEWIQSNDK